MEMRQTIAASALLFALILAGASAWTGWSDDVPTVTREVMVGTQGLLTVRDEITTAGLSELIVLLHDRERLLGYAVEGGTVIDTKEAGGRLELTVKPAGNRVRVSSAYRGLLTEAADGAFALSFRGAPVLANVEHSTNVTFVLPPDAEDVRVPAEHRIEDKRVNRFYAKSLGSEERTTIRFRSHSVILAAVEKVQVTVDPSTNFANVLIRVRNDGASSFDSISAKIPLAAGATVLRVGDNLGSVRYGYDKTTGGLTVYFTPERYALSPGWRYEFSITMRVEPGTLVRLEGDVLKVKAFLPLDAPVEGYSIRVILPDGVELQSVGPQVQQYFPDDRGRYVVDLSLPVPYFSPYEFELRVRGQPQQPIPAYLLLLGALVLFAGVIASVVRTTRGQRARVAESDRASIERLRSRVGEVFVELDRVEELLRSPSRSGLQQLQESVRRVRRLTDLLYQDIRVLPQRSAELSRVATEAQRSLQQINESLRAILHAYNSYQRGEIAKSAMEKMVAPMLRDVRRSSSSLREFEQVLSELLG